MSDHEPRGPRRSAAPPETNELLSRRRNKMDYDSAEPREWSPMDSVFWRMHLDWMKENQPELVLQLWKDNLLQDHLDKKVDAALGAVIKAKKRGATEEEAQEQVIA